MQNIINNNFEHIFDELLIDAINKKKELSLKISGSSMEPIIKDGDLISFKKIEIHKLKRLDLIVFKDRINNNLISHRFIKSVDNNGHIYIFTKADTSKKYDNPIVEEDFIGLINKIKKPDKIIYLNSWEGRLRSYINIFLAPVYLFIKKICHKQKEYYKNENELLTLVSRINLDKTTLTRIEELLSNFLDWDYISSRVKENFIAPFFLKNIINSGLKENVPSEVEEEIEQTYRWQVYYDTKVHLELKNVLSAFNHNKIKVMVIKGAHLKEEIYGYGFFRWMGDVDILAKKVDDWSKIKDILVGLGFKFREKSFDSWGLNYLDNHITFLKGKIKLELKFNIWHMDFPYFKNDLWQRAREKILIDEKVLVPSIEDTLLIACVNVTRHNYVGLIWLCDIREIIDRFGKKLNWDEVIRCAKEKDIDCMVYYSLYYASKLLNFRIPEGVIERLKPPFIRRKLHNFFWNEKVILWENVGSPIRAKIPFEIATFLFAGKIRFKPKKLLKMFLYISSIIISNRTHLSTHYGVSKNSPRLILYYLLQPFRFLAIMLKGLTAIILNKRN